MGWRQRPDPRLAWVGSDEPPKIVGGITRVIDVTEVVTPRAAVPEVGQIVTVRGANWAVVDVQQQGLGRSTADDATAQLQHAVTLQSVQEDRLGHELRVVWELEQGRSALAHRGLPDEIDPAQLRRPQQARGLHRRVALGCDHQR